MFLDVFGMFRLLFTLKDIHDNSGGLFMFNKKETFILRTVKDIKDDSKNI